MTDYFYRDKAEIKRKILLKYKAREIARLMKWNFDYQDLSNAYKINDGQGHEITLSIPWRKPDRIAISSDVWRGPDITVDARKDARKIVLSDIKGRFFPGYKEAHAKKSKELKDLREEKQTELEVCLYLAKVMKIKYDSKNKNCYGYGEMSLKTNNYNTYCDISHESNGQIRADLKIKTTVKKAEKILQILNQEEQ